VKIAGTKISETCCDDGNHSKAKSIISMVLLLMIIKVKSLYF
jgi:hypothetical protein